MKQPWSPPVGTPSPAPHLWGGGPVKPERTGSRGPGCLDGGAFLLPRVPLPYPAPLESSAASLSQGPRGLAPLGWFCQDKNRLSGLGRESGPLTPQLSPQSKVQGRRGEWAGLGWGVQVGEPGPC